MNDKPKSQSSFRHLLALWGILFLGCLLLFGGIFGYFGLHDIQRTNHVDLSWITVRILLWSCSIATFGVCLRVLIRWLSHWRNLRRALAGTAIFATLIAVFYAEEDWRGKRDWEAYKASLEAQGLVMDWDKFIRPPVPDDQNFFKASPKIQYNFIRPRNNEETEFFAKQPQYDWGWWKTDSTNHFPNFDTRSNGPIVVATITITPTTAASTAYGTNDHAFLLNNPATPASINKVLTDTLGIMADGAQGFRFSQHDLYHLPRPWINLLTDSTPSVADLQNLIGNPGTNFGRFEIKPVASGGYEVQLNGCSNFTPAADYLKWSDQYAPDFDEIREALKRPYAQLVGDFSSPPEIPLPKFVVMRSLCQILAQRTQCYLMLGEPDKALRELTLMNDSLRITHGVPASKPLTLVAAMIEVAIRSVYSITVGFGLQHHLWQEPQLEALQSQFANVNLPGLLYESFNDEQAYDVRIKELLPPLKLYESESILGKSIWEKMGNRNFLVIKFMPRGWMDQNLIYAVREMREPLAGIDPTNQLFYPAKIKAIWPQIQADMHHWSPFRLWANIAIPNYEKAITVTAHNQSQANEALIACALERYHLAHGNYPNSLDALVPQYLSALPHDVIGGGPLKYHTTGDGNFVLYSIGWNETDDGGVTSTNMGQGDWVWTKTN